MGLSLARNLAKALGGNVILLGSEIGKGCIFRISVDAGIERFRDAPKEKEGSEYSPVKLVRKYALSDLPSDETFQRECDPPDEEDQ